ncbi:MAG: two-component system, OmpR family, response regulator [Thermotogota bacterium]|nr:two-component system, OmpR family, response regulator [Thermotogota bacterium]MDK2864447.1 two-component system, OmpR family, response regulator [Thermotogota bacterium]
MKVLVLEDDPKIARFLELELTHEGFDVRTVSDGYDALVVVEEFQPDVVLVDIMVPGIDGVEFTRRIRERREDVGIIMVTALGEKKNKLEGFESGADDYVVKPFDIEELLARINAVARRSRLRSHDVIEVGNINIDLASRKVVVNGEEVELSKTEFELLVYLARNVDTVLSKERILDAVWGSDFYGGTNVVEVYVNYLRKKLGGESWRLKTVRGVGYVLRSDDA